MTTSKRRRVRIGRGATWDAAAKTLRLSVYVKGDKGRGRSRTTVHGVATREDAERVMTEFRAKVNRDGAGPARIATLTEFVAGYFDNIARRLAAKTVADYRLLLDRRILPRFGKLALTAITSGVVNVWVGDLLAEGLAGATVNDYVNVLRAIVGYAVRFDVLEESPFRKPIDRAEVVLPRNELSATERAALLAAFDDREKFLAYYAARHREGTVVACRRYPSGRVFGGARRPDSAAMEELWQRHRFCKPFFTLLLATGLRLNDLRSVMWSDVRWAEGWIHRVMQKTKRDVFVPISDECAAALREVRARSLVGQLVFIDETGAHLSVTRIRRTFAIAKAIAGIVRKCRLHDLRHTFGSSLASEGLSTAIISRVMGHQSQQQTERYARPDNRVMAAVKAAQDRIATPQQP